MYQSRTGRLFEGLLASVREVSRDCSGRPGGGGESACDGDGSGHRGTRCSPESPDWVRRARLVRVEQFSRSRFEDSQKIEQSKEVPGFDACEGHGLVGAGFRTGKGGSCPGGRRGEVGSADDLASPTIGAIRCAAKGDSGGGSIQAASD